MKITDKYRDQFLHEKSLNIVSNYRYQHGKQVYETACIECLERLSKLNEDRLNYMMQKENVCAFILVLGLSKYLKYKDFFEFLSYVYDDGKEHNIKEEKNLEMIIKFFISGYDNLVMQRQTNLNVEQLQESDETILLAYFEQIQNEENPIGRMQELVSKHIKENIILGFSDDEILDLSFLGLFRLSEEAASLFSNKKKRKTRLFLLCLPFVLFYIHEQKIFDLNTTYATLIRYKKQLNRLNQRDNDNQVNLVILIKFLRSLIEKEKIISDFFLIEEIQYNGFNDGEVDAHLDELLPQDESNIKFIKQKMEQSPLFRDLEAKTSNQLSNLKSQLVSTKGKKKTLQTPAMGGVASNQQVNGGGQLICSNTGKSPAFISILHQDQKIREPTLAAGILPVQQKDPAQNKAIETLVHVSDSEKKTQQSDFILNIMSEPYNYSEDENLVSENDNPKGQLLELAIKHFKTHSCLQFKSTLINQKEFECILLFQDNSIYTRGRAINKKGCEKIASAKMIPLIQEYIQQKEQQNNKPKKLILFSTHTNQTLKKTDKINNDLKNHHPQLQKQIENNLYHQASNSSSQSSNSHDFNQEQKRNNNKHKRNNHNNNNQHHHHPHHHNQPKQNQQNYIQKGMPEIGQVQQPLMYNPLIQMNQFINFYNPQLYPQMMPNMAKSFSVNNQNNAQQNMNLTRTQSNNEYQSSQYTTPTPDFNQQTYNNK